MFDTLTMPELRNLESKLHDATHQAVIHAGHISAGMHSELVHVYQLCSLEVEWRIHEQLVCVTPEVN